jgi:ATPase subunit of ABC transporter with duplicated ATPase domains
MKPTEKKIDLKSRLDLTPISGTKLMAEIKPLDFVVEDIFAEGYLYTLTARNNQGKSTLMALLTKCITEGLLSGENTPDTLLKLKAIDCDPAMFDLIDTSYSMREYVDDQLNSLIHDYAGIFVDSNQAYFGDGEMNGNSDALAHAQALRRLTKASGKPFSCVLSHPTKSNPHPC